MQIDSESFVFELVAEDFKELRTEDVEDNFLERRLVRDPHSCTRGTADDDDDCDGALWLRAVLRQDEEDRAQERS